MEKPEQIFWPTQYNESTSLHSVGMMQNLTSCLSESLRFFPWMNRVFRVGLRTQVHLDLRLQVFWIQASLLAIDTCLSNYWILTVSSQA